MKSKTYGWLLFSTALCVLPTFAFAQKNSAKDDAQETLNFYESNVDNAKYFTLDTAIPTTPGLVLAGATAFDDIGHDLGSDLTYELGFTESGIPQLGLSMRPYWSLFRAFRSSEVSFDRYNNFSDGKYDRGPFHWLKRTQVSVGLASTKKDKAEQLGAGLGVLFYPLNDTDPRSDEELGKCLRESVDKAFPKVTETISTAQSKATDQVLTSLISEIDLSPIDLALDKPDVRELYKDEIIVVDGETKLKPGTRLKNVSYSFAQRTTQEELAALVQELVQDQLGRNSPRNRAIMEDFDRKFELRSQPDLPDPSINAILKKAGVANPEYKRDASNPAQYQGDVERRITSYLSGLPVDNRPDQTRRDLILADFKTKMQIPEIRTSLSKSYVDSFLRTWLIESPDIDMPEPPSTTVAGGVEKYLRSRGDLSEGRIAAALGAIEKEKEKRIVASVSVADINDFLTSHGLDRSWKGPARDVAYDVGSYLRDERSDVSDAGQSSIALKVSEEVNKSVNSELQKVTASSAGFANSEIKKCREEATKRYLGKRELVFGVGVAAKSSDNTFDNLDYAGVSLWTRYRVPIFLSGKIDDKGKLKAPDGHLAFFGRYIEDDKILVAKDQMEDAQTWILGATAQAERPNVKFSLSLSYNDRDIVNSMIDDQDFWRLSAGWSQRLNERIWLETEFGEILGDTPFNEGAFGRVGLRFDGGLKF